MRRTQLLTLVSLLLACDGEDAPQPPATPELEAGAASADAQTMGVAPSSDAGGGPGGSNSSSNDAGQAAAEAGASAPGVGDSGADAAPAVDPGLDFPDALSWSTAEFELGPDQERYLCFASTLEADAVVNAFATKAQAFVHHLIFSRSNSPEDKLGFEECDTAFRSGWQPLFITGAGNARLELPSDAGHKLAKGTKLVVQMHLLNFKKETVKGAVSLNMRRSAHASPRPVSTYIFGTAAVSLPPRQKTDITGECTLRESVKLIAGFPHMHMLGKALRVEVGSASGEMKTVFNRDPYWFDAQTIELLDLQLKAGDRARVTCNFNNTTDQTVGYGESTKT
ncbi:MAG TPA: hypothetical protein VFZ61_20750, partial [Polyangiales bacterium]